MNNQQESKNIKLNNSDFTFLTDQKSWLKIPADGSPLTFTGNADEAAKEFFNALIRVRDGYISALKAERDALQKRADALAVENAALKDVLKSICCRDNEPEYHDCGMGCGLEDRGITDRYAAMEHGWESAMERIYEEVIPFIDDLPETPATDAALAAIHARFCELLDTYGKVEPERFNPEFADLYAKIANRIFSSVMDNPHVIDIDSMTEWLEISAVDARAYADMSIKFHAELREAK